MFVFERLHKYKFTKWQDRIKDVCEIQTNIGVVVCVYSNCILYTTVDCTVKLALVNYIMLY